MDEQTDIQMDGWTDGRTEYGLNHISPNHKEGDKIHAKYTKRYFLFPIPYTIRADLNANNVRHKQSNETKSNTDGKYSVHVISSILI